MTYKSINIPSAYSTIDQLWDPHIAGRVNDCEVRIAKIHGNFDWHSHENEDEAFYVVKGQFIMEMRDQHVKMNEGDFFVVPRGVEHRPVADDECWIMMIEPSTTKNTGNVKTDKTKDKLKQL